MSRDTLNYKGYLGAVRFDDEEGVLRGSVVNIRDFVTFQGRSVDELRTEFRESIEDSSNSAPLAVRNPTSPSPAGSPSG